MTEIKNDMSFEQGVAELKETVEALENPEKTIEESIALYEKACMLATFCQQKLNDANERIININEHIRGLGSDGAPAIED